MKKCGAFCFIIRQKTGEYGKNPINCIGSFMLRQKADESRNAAASKNIFIALKRLFVKKDASFMKKKKEKEKVK